MYARIIAISLYSNEIEIGGPLFFKNQPDGAGCGLKFIESKKWHQTEKPIFYDKQICFYTYWRFFHSKSP